MSSFLSQIEDQYSPYTWPRLIYSLLRVPAYHIYFELILIAGIIWLIFKKGYKIQEKTKLSDTEKQQLIDEWNPEPIVPATWSPPKRLLERFHRASIGSIGKYVTFENKPSNAEGFQLANFPHLNVASLNFLDLIGNEDLNKVAIEALHKYGLGSCGPRGFYGTFDAHLNLEKTLETFLGVEEVALYSYAFSTIASAIPAYAKRDDIIFADEGVSQAVHEGLNASRSCIKFFRHNDMDHLESLLLEQAKKDEINKTKAFQIKRFFVIEGLYLDSGDICPLKKIIELKYKYKVRLIMDESISFGVLGSMGRGATEYFGVLVEHVDVLTGSLETAIGMSGGFCAGSHFVVDHQRLSGQGYCFSASSPPLLACAADAAISKLVMENGTRQKRLLEISNQVHTLLTNENGVALYWKTEGHPDSPVKHIRLLRENSIERLEDAVDLASFIPANSNNNADNEMQTVPLLLTVARHSARQNRKLPLPSIRLSLNTALTDAELQHICTVLIDVGKKMF